MRCAKRFVTTAIAIVILSLNCACAPASGLDDGFTAIAVLQAKADQAQPRDRCFLYAELVSQMTELAIRKANSGDSEQVSKTLKLVNQYAENIHLGVVDNSRKLKDAEMLIDRASFRLKDLHDDGGNEDRSALQETLNKLYQVRTQLMMRVFEK